MTNGNKNQRQHRWRVSHWEQRMTLQQTTPETTNSTTPGWLLCVVYLRNVGRQWHHQNTWTNVKEINWTVSSVHRLFFGGFEMIPFLYLAGGFFIVESIRNTFPEHVQYMALLFANTYPIESEQVCLLVPGESNQKRCQMMGQRLVLWSAV